MLDISLYYPVFTAMVGFAFLLVIPKERYKHYFLWGLIFGGIGDALTVSLLTMLNLIDYKNMGPFGILNLFSIWTPLAWGLTFGLFFFFLPVRKPFLIPYVLAFAGLSYSIGLVMESLGMFGDTKVSSCPYLCSLVYGFRLDLHQV